MNERDLKGKKVKVLLFRLKCITGTITPWRIDGERRVHDRLSQWDSYAVPVHCVGRTGSETVSIGDEEGIRSLLNEFNE